VCGFYPFAAGSSRPLVGVPVGHDLHTHATVCCDPLAWFEAGLTSSPSMFVVGLQGQGKSSFVVRQILGLADRGVAPLVAGDLKPDYTQVIRALGGQVVQLGGGQALNVLDPGAMGHAADRIGGSEGAVIREQAVHRSATMVAGLVQLMRRQPVEDWEGALLARCIRSLSDTHRARGEQPPDTTDLAHLLRHPTEGMVRAVMADDEAEFLSLTKPLSRSLEALLDGPLGTIFGGQTTEPLRPDATGVCVDISVVARQGEAVLAAVMLACWSDVYGMVEASNALADTGREPQRHYVTVLDEMWRPLRVDGAGLVDKLDQLTRLNRADGVGHIYVTHSPKDLESMSSRADSLKARGFMERSSIIVAAGLAREDLRALSDVRHLTDVEMETVAGWSTPPGWQPRQTTDPVTGVTRPEPPPGAGKVLIKVGQRAGIATQVVLTRTEHQLHDTNTRWTQGGTK
jgi:hypothetical protein